MKCLEVFGGIRILHLSSLGWVEGISNVAMIMIVWLHGICVHVVRRWSKWLSDILRIRKGFTEQTAVFGQMGRGNLEFADEDDGCVITVDCCCGSAEVMEVAGCRS